MTIPTDKALGLGFEWVDVRMCLYDDDDDDDDDVVEKSMR